MCESENRRTAAGYVRVSSTNNDADIQRGIAAQKDAIQQFAQESGRDVVWYVDGEKSVEDSNDEDGSLRPALRRLLDDAGSPDCGFDTVLVSSVSCLSRNSTHSILVRRALQDAGVDVRSIFSGDDIPPPPEEKLIEGILDVVDRFYKETLSEAARQGWRTRRARADEDQDSAQG